MCDPWYPHCSYMIYSLKLFCGQCALCQYGLSRSRGFCNRSVMHTWRVLDLMRCHVVLDRGRRGLSVGSRQAGCGQQERVSTLGPDEDIDKKRRRWEVRRGRSRRDSEDVRREILDFPWGDESGPSPESGAFHDSGPPSNVGAKGAIDAGSLSHCGGDTGVSPGEIRLPCGWKPFWAFAIRALLEPGFHAQSYVGGGSPTY